jgi:hypothetical protein
MAAVTAEYASDQVDATTLAVNVDEFMPWSAKSIRYLLRASTLTGSGSLPVNMYR